MFCIECGKCLPDGAKFCAFCGKPLPQLSGVQPAPAAYTEPPAASPGGANDMDVTLLPHLPGTEPVSKGCGCSEKQEDMVYAPGRGVYFVSYDELFFFSEESRKVSQLTKKQDDDRLVGLNLWNNEVFIWKIPNFWTMLESKPELIAIDINSHQKRTVTLKYKGEDLPYIFEYPDLRLRRFYVQDGFGYGICKDGRYLYVLDMSTGEYQLRELPDLRRMPLWTVGWTQFEYFKKILGSKERRSMVNYGLRWGNLYIKGRQGYTALDDAMRFVVRFSLRKPSIYHLLPADCGSIVGNESMISEYWDTKNDRVLLVGIKPGDESILNITDFSEGVRLLEPIRLKTGEYEGLSVWWRCGSNYVIKNNLLDMETLKISRLPIEIKSIDFAETSNGVYLMWGDFLYHLPKNFKEVIKSEEDLNRYIAAKLE